MHVSTLEYNHHGQGLAWQSPMYGAGTWAGLTVPLIPPAPRPSYRCPATDTGHLTGQHLAMGCSLEELCKAMEISITTLASAAWVKFGLGRCSSGTACACLKSAECHIMHGALLSCKSHNGQTAS